MSSLFEILRQIRKSARAVKDYRVAQVAQNLTNHVLSKPCLQLTLGLTIIAEISALYVMIISSNHLTVDAAMFFVLMGVDYFIVIHVVLRALSKSYVTSVKFIQSMKRLHKRDPWFKKFLRSCPSLKVGMGDGKFFDGLTSLVIWQFCVDRLISLLLL